MEVGDVFIDNDKYIYKIIEISETSITYTYNVFEKKLLIKIPIDNFISERKNFNSIKLSPLEILVLGLI